MRFFIYKLEFKKCHPWSILSTGLKWWIRSLKKHAHIYFFCDIITYNNMEWFMRNSFIIVNRENLHIAMYSLCMRDKKGWNKARWKMIQRHNEFKIMMYILPAWQFTFSRANLKCFFPFSSLLLFIFF